MNNRSTKNKLKLLSVLCLLMLNFAAFSQGEITVDYKTKRYVGNESLFNRRKYLNFHAWFKKTDTDFEKFKKEYNIDPNYNGSRLFNNPGRRHKNGKFPSVKQNYSGVRKVSHFVSTGSPKFFYYDKNIDYSTVDVGSFSKATARYTGNYFANQAEEVPEFFEPFNEPMVHAGDFLGDFKKGKNRNQKVKTIINQMIAYHADVIDAVKATPELKNMKVGGYGSAFPEFEANNFGLWNSRFKKFIDVTGKNIDFLALHLYDGSGVNNKTGLRSGSNSEAILDMLEAYSYLATGKVIPYAITEYGRLVPNQPDYKINGNYVPLVNAQAVRSQLNMVMNFIERGDQLLLSVPFTVGKQRLRSTYSKSSLWVEQPNGTYELSQRKYFFEVWKDIKGDRVAIHSTNIDVQAQAFANRKQLFVVLNNLNIMTQQVDLKLMSTNGLKDVKVKRLNIFEDKLPELTVTKQREAPKSMKLNYGETVVLTYTFKSGIKYNNTVYSKKYYAETYLQPIKANEVTTFSIKDVEEANEATLRLGIGREHGLSLNPIVEVNGNIVEIKGDVIRGNDQKVRKQFFGILEIPIKNSYLNAGENKVEISFPDDGGHISSVILQIQNTVKPM